MYKIQIMFAQVVKILQIRNSHERIKKIKKKKNKIGVKKLQKMLRIYKNKDESR
jgi:hypothetical protein